MNDLGPLILGIFIIVLGVYNTKGHISSIHWYHRRRVTEEDRIPFGKLVGRGTIIIGASLIVFSGSAAAAETFQNDLFKLLGIITVISGMIVGLGMNFYAMIKYNNGIF